MKNLIKNLHTFKLDVIIYKHKQNEKEEEIMNIAVYGAASSLIDNSYKEAGIELGRKMVDRGCGLVFGGGANGMMGAVAQGVYEKGGYILGVVPEFFKEANAEISFKKCTDYIYTETMRERKQQMEEHCDAFIISPGGIGTLDEFFEILTLKQLGRHNKAIVIYNINGFYDEIKQALKKFVDEKFITEDCVQLCKISSDVDEILDYILSYDPKDIDLSRVKIR